jgi:hypothetical protein
VANFSYPLPEAIFRGGKGSTDELILSVAAYEKSTFCFFIGTNFFKVNIVLISSVCKAQS